MVHADAVALELFNHSLASITDEMMITTNRTGRSTATQYLMDFSAALFDENGELLIQGIATPHHLGAMPAVMRSILEAFAVVRPGDVYIMNDPYQGGIHLPDIFTFKPIFSDDDQLLGFSCLMSHHVDVGGRVPGSMAADSKSIHEEGLRLPPVQLVEGGVLNKTLIDVITANVRLPEIVLADLRAQIAACTVGERELQRLARMHGVARVRDLRDGLVAQTERVVRAAIAEIPDGVYEFVDFVDDDGVSNQPLRIQVAMEVAGDRIHVDFSGSSPQTAGAVNSVTALTSVCTVLRCLLPPSTPNNAGAFRPVTVHSPEGTFLNPQYPAACAARGPTAYRVDDALFGALSKALPGVIPAASDGGNSSMRIAGSKDGKTFILAEVICGSRGGRPGSDGIEGVCNPQQNISNTPVEAVEADYPVRVREYAFVPDTGGAGQYRGGLAIAREWEMLTDVTLQMRSDRRVHTPWGLQGGLAGTGSRCVCNPGTSEQTDLPAKFVISMQAGEVFRHEIASGGGYGPPEKRTRQAVLEDMAEGKITPQYAQATYGVAAEQ